LNDIVAIGGRSNGYSYASITETKCQRVGMVCVSIASIANFPGEPPTIEQHYLRMGQEIRPVWAICRGGTIVMVVDCITQEEINDVEE